MDASSLFGTDPHGGAMAQLTKVPPPGKLNNLFRRRAGFLGMKRSRIAVPYL
jgi:hypothetical protein